RRAVAHRLVHHPGLHEARLDGLAHAAQAVDGVNRVEVVAAAALDRASARLAHAEAGADDRLLEVVDREGVAGEDDVHPALADEAGERGRPARVDDGRPGYHHDPLPRG